ncbi:holin [Mycobacterium phage Fowlmouth]|uniref:Holin n=2 Tax=Fowlmouthvirus fowlmouth TaxID=2845652 RepID=A0A7G8LPS3_9CAUD|nr:holin [Mycobacterium phage Fowlmouth]AYN57980.1 holin [Mycobacterium phage Fowlmouth]QNJ59245.1 holin [Mycobacterium phage MrMiyagi]
MQQSNLVVPTNGVMPLKTLDDWRAMFHQVVPIIVTALVTANIVTDSQVTLWLPFVFAIADNLLSVGNATDRVRKAIYSIFALLQGGSAVTTILVSHQELTPIITAGITIASAIFANFYTPTSTMQPAMRVGSDMKDVGA